MDFFGHQHQARKASGRLVWLFAAAVLCIVLLIYLAAKLLLGIAEVGDSGLVDWPVLGVVAAAVVAVVLGAMAFKSAQLSSGGAAVAEMMGGRPVDPHTRDPQERMLMNVVEEMAIASGVPVPDVYVLDSEQGINAFAAGWSTQDAAVAVTRGSLDTFTRDELQGVIAHEFSHVFHGDMRLNIRLMGTLFGIVCIAVIGRLLVHTGGRGRRDGQHLALFGLALLVIGYAGVFFARLIQAAVSRQREYLADASAVQYTRNPKGIGMALAKIGGLTGRLENPHAEEASHMLFAEGVAGLGGGMATHPPIEERVERVLPGFLKRAANSDSLVQAVADTPAPELAAGAMGFAGSTPKRLLESVGDPQPRHVAAARQLLDDLPLDLGVAAHEPDRAPGLVYALLLDPDERERSRQVELLAEAGAVVQHDAQAFFREVNELPRTTRLPLLELAMPALRRLPRDQRAALRRRARALALADDHLSPFEFALLKTLERHVPENDRAPIRRRGRPEAIADHVEHVSQVLSVIAHAGSGGDEDEAKSAFARGCEVLSVPDAQLTPADRATPQQLDQAIDALERVSPLGKRNLIQACAEVAAHDGHLDPDEVDLVRALAELWECPVPLAVSE
ncbi:MAG: M48 family metalloprotease [Planctomycetes bacterium]|nr:M48 family metalloprotease [Planctomycetota bacterium]